MVGLLNPKPAWLLHFSGQSNFTYDLERKPSFGETSISRIYRKVGRRL
jgi:hypothetical protein